ncbi:AAA family ATPase [Nannocystaceae bacterium ST9]
MKADPRGAVELSEAVGREALVERLWSSLLESSVLLQGRAGLGKTTLVRLALADAPTGWRGRRVAASELHSADALAGALVEALWLEHHEPGPRLRSALESAMSSGKLVGEPIPILREAIAGELADRANGLLLAIDDVDRFVDANADRGLELGELIATFDELTRAHPRLRLLVVSHTRLQRSFERMRPRPPRALLAGYRKLAMEPLGPEAGARLAATLLLGESITARDRPGLARKIADALDQVPRWIHATLLELGKQRGPIGEGRLDELLARIVGDPGDPWGLRADLAPVLHGYVEPTRRIALSLLDRIAAAGAQGLTFEALHRQLAMETTLDADAVRRVLDELVADQICEQAGDQLRFAATLLRRTWVAMRKIQA